MSRLRGRFGEAVGEDMLRFSSSLSVDLRLLDEDVDASMAHVEMLGEAGILATEEARELCRALEQIRGEIRDGVWTPGPEHEDLHMALESRLVEKLGEVGQKLHTARSRNDQVATDVRLWIKRAVTELERELGALIGTLLDRVESDGAILLPGYTHLQRGQPILLGHHLLAHAWPLARDRGRFRDARGRLDRSPLGACAMAGTAHPIDRDRAAELLGFAGTVPNAMDAVAARDHLQEVVAACAICMAHLSRMAEELVLWSSSEFAFARVADAYATGSSIMPQKRNPDAAELIRGKTGRVFGDLQSLLVLVKALPLAYNRDLQEDKTPLFDAIDTTRACVRIMTGLWTTLELVRDRFEPELRDDFSLATELADWLAQRGVPFREAHDIVGRWVRDCEAQGRGPASLGAGELRTLHPGLGSVPGDLLDPRAAAQRRASSGGTAPAEIERQVALLRRDL